MPPPRSLETVARLLARLPPPRPAVRRGLDAAVGQVLAEDLVALGAVPDRAVALLDGVAVASGDLVGASPYSPAVLVSPPRPVRAGDALPAGTDAVLPAAAVVLSGGLAEVGLAAAPGENVRRAGEDIGTGALLRRAGEVLRPLDAALARLAGHADVPVRSAVVAISCSAADRALLAAVLAAATAGASVRFEAGAAADLALVFDAGEGSAEGGLALTEAEGCRAVPDGDGMAILAPARAATAFALARAVVAPALDRLLGRLPAPIWRRAPLLRKLPSRIGFSEIALLREAGGGLEPLAVGVLPLVALARAEGYLILPPESEGLPAGSLAVACPV